MLVLTYHSISGGPPPLCVAAGELARHLDLLEAAGYEPTTLSALTGTLERGDAPKENSFLTTFDDGYRDFAETAWPLLRERSVRPLLFAVAGPDRANLAGGIGQALLEFDELAALSADGVDIGAHGICHVDLRKLGADELERELAGGREILEQAIGRSVESFAYPFGAYDERVRLAATRHFRTAFTTQLSALHPWAEASALARIDAFYLSAPWLHEALGQSDLTSRLTRRRWLRRVRGSEPRIAIPTR